MKILLVAPRTTNIRSATFDYVVWNFLLPLKTLGHQVEFYDTYLTTKDKFLPKVEEFEPELIFCILTGDPGFGRNEPWDELEAITDEGKITTFNWFCDDAWRFDDWSCEKAATFTAVSTTEPHLVSEYHNLGYENVRYFNWHSNESLYSIPNCPNQYDITFVGSMYGDRTRILSEVIALHPELENRIKVFSKVSFEEMIYLMNMSKISLSFAQNPNGPCKQMKGRMFEIPATNSLMVTEYTQGIEKSYEPNKEAVFFENSKELGSKLIKLLSNNIVRSSIADAGFARYQKDHTSEKRLGELLEWLRYL